MGLRSRKSIKIAPGVRLNVGSKSVGISAGVKGARVSTNTRTGTRATVSIPGTGLSYTEKIGGKKAPARSSSKSNKQVWSGYIVGCGQCGSQLELPPFDDPNTRFVCGNCQGGMRLSPELQAELLGTSVVVVAPVVATPVVPPPVPVYVLDPISYCDTCSSRNDIPNAQRGQLYRCKACDSPLRIRTIQQKTAAWDLDEQRAAEVEKQRKKDQAASDAGLQGVFILGAGALIWFLMWVTG